MAELQAGWRRWVPCWRLPGFVSGKTCTPFEVPALAGDTEGGCGYQKLPDKGAQATIAIWPSPRCRAANGSSSNGKNGHDAYDSAAGLVLVRQVFPPFLVAGLGMVAAGILLGIVRSWPVFLEASEMLILVPALLGLKGNLEMTLASRLSTHANLGHLDAGGRMWSIVLGNLAVVQSQAIVVGLLSSLVAVSLELFSAGVWHPGHILLLSSSAVSAASIASLLLATIMIIIVLASRRYGINPDNVAAPIAGMLGDFCTLSLLAGFAQLLWDYQQRWSCLQQAVVSFYCLIAPLCARVAYRNTDTYCVLREGWMPVVLSMIISSGGGLILKHAVLHFSCLAPFAPVMNGAGGNLAAVQASRISTDLHARGSPGTPIPPQQYPGQGCFHVGPAGQERIVEEPVTPKATFTALLSANLHAGTARILIMLAVPGALCFVFLIVGLQSRWSALPNPLFLLAYVVATLLQACFLFVAAHGLVRVLWVRGINPDNAATPYVTALGDVAGTTCLLGAFYVLDLFGASPWT